MLCPCKSLKVILKVSRCSGIPPLIAFWTAEHQWAEHCPVREIHCRELSALGDEILLPRILFANLFWNTCKRSISDFKAGWSSHTVSPWSKWGKTKPLNYAMGVLLSSISKILLNTDRRWPKFFNKLIR